MPEIKELRAKIKNDFWPRLIRQMDAANIDKVCSDTKRELGTPKVLIPPGQKEQLEYYSKIPGVDVIELPKDRSEWPKYVHTPGILALAWKEGKPLPYPVPGGRFNEFYGWDSYFIALGLINDGYTELAETVQIHFDFEIEHYGLVLNANRPYMLLRGQPPFCTDLAWKLKPYTTKEAFVRAIKWAIVEYETAWTAEPRLDKATGLSKYNPGIAGGIPPEVEPGHFDHVIKPFAEKRGITINEYIRSYCLGRDPEFDEFLRHDIAIRESGHDVTSRFIGTCADTATVDLNCLLYKYEIDIAQALEEFPVEFEGQGLPSVDEWRSRAQRRRDQINALMWDNERNLFYDYNCKTRQKAPILGAMTLAPLWAGLATEAQAQKLVPAALDKLEFAGGLASTEKSNFFRSWQWDYPAGWAPHQILAWEGLRSYGFTSDAERLEKKWTQVVLKSYAATGAVYEKYNVVDTEKAHEVLAEYGNQGSSTTGFGWTNASISCARVNNI